MIVEYGNGNTIDIDLNEEEHKMLLFCIKFAPTDPFNSRDDVLIKLVAKLWNYLTQDEGD